MIKLFLIIILLVFFLLSFVILYLKTENVYLAGGHCCRRQTTLILVLLLILFGSHTVLSPQSPPQVTLEGTLTMYMVTRYGDSLQEIDRYRKTTKEGEYVAFILKTDKKMDLEQYLDKEDAEALKEYCGETLQSEFDCAGMMVNNFIPIFEKNLLLKSAY